MDNQEQRGGRRGGRGRGHHHHQQNDQGGFHKHDRNGQKYGNNWEGDRMIPQQQPSNQVSNVIQPASFNPQGQYPPGLFLQQQWVNQNNQGGGFNRWGGDNQQRPDIEDRGEQIHRGERRMRGEGRGHRGDRGDRGEGGSRHEKGGHREGGGRHHKRDNDEKPNWQRDQDRQGDEVFRSGHRRDQGRGRGQGGTFNNRRDKPEGWQQQRQEKDQKFLENVQRHIQKYNNFNSLTPENAQKLQSQLDHLSRLKSRTVDPNTIFVIDQNAAQIKQLLSTKPIQNAQMKQEQLDRKVVKRLSRCNKICDKFTQYGSMKDHNWDHLNEDKQFFEKHFQTISLQYQEQVRQTLVLMNDVLSLRVARNEASEVRRQQNQQRQPQQNQNQNQNQQPAPQQREQVNQVNQDDDSKLCIICISNPRTHLAIPCGHFMYCDPCSNQLKDCAFCRKKVDSFTKVFS